MDNKPGVVLLAFSGGIDSCHAARVLTQEGYKVIGLTMDMTGDTELIEQARHKASEIGIELIVEDVRSQFKSHVTDYFTSEYTHGRTPAPCTVCNFHIKWKTLYDKALALGVDHIATGHYFNISEQDGYYYVTKGKDPIKDQSYYLWMLPQEILAMAVTPMGGVVKNDIKKLLRNGESKKESMGVCFLNGRSYKEYLLDHIDTDTATITKGRINDTNGNTIGRHEGAAFYTIGQKKGLEIPSDYSVVGIDATNNIVIAGQNDLLYQKTLIVSDHHLVRTDKIENNNNITVKVRGLGRNPERPCVIKLLDNKTMEIRLDDAAWAPAQGQPVVLYDEDLVLGGGFLLEAY